jgi:hypothetical protein
MTEEERIAHSLKWGTDYAKNKGYTTGVISNGMSETGQQLTGPVQSNRGSNAPAVDFNTALQEYWDNNPDQLEQAIRENPDAFSEGLLGGQKWYTDPTPWVGEIDRKNLGMTGLNEEDYRLFRSSQ